jgi:hypothetical protein
MNAEVRAAIAAIAQKQLSLVTLADLAGLELTRRDIAAMQRRGEWRAVQPGVFAPAACNLTPEGAVLAAVLSAGRGAYASHGTAAALHRFPGYSLSGPIHVTVPNDRRPSGVEAVVHYSRAVPPHHRVMKNRVPTSSVARTIFDLARPQDAKRVERALDNALVMKLVAVPAVERVFIDLAGSGRGGTVLMRALLDERRDGFVVPRSRIEREFLALVRAYELPAPRREIDLGSNESWNGRVEFVFDPGVLVEVDGRRWHTALLDIEADNDRDNGFSTSDFIVLRYRWRMVAARPAEVAAEVRRAIALAESRWGADSAERLRA